MKKLLTIALLWAAQPSYAQSFIGSPSQVVTAHLDSSKSKYRAVLDRAHKPMFITCDVDGGAVVYYFKSGLCIEQSVVEYYADIDVVKGELDHKYSKQGEDWYDDANNACIRIAIAGSTVFINAVKYNVD